MRRQVGWLAGHSLLSSTAVVFGFLGGFVLPSPVAGIWFAVGWDGPGSPILRSTCTARRHTSVFDTGGVGLLPLLPIQTERFAEGISIPAIWFSLLAECPARGACAVRGRTAHRFLSDEIPEQMIRRVLAALTVSA
jgi:hypothetical protein